MALQDQSKFVFECHLAMMFLLFLNIGHDPRVHLIRLLKTRRLASQNRLH